jgi:hypothetical protein
LEKKVTEPKAHSVRYHEAGHAVVARLLGIPVNEVTARPARGAKFRGLTVVTVDGIGPFAGLDLRREFTALMGAGITWPFAALAQAGRSYRLGCLLPATRDTPVNVAFFEEVRRRGFIEGQNLTVDYRAYGPHVDLISQYAAELVKARVDVIVVAGGMGVRAARQATKTIPIVALAEDMLGSGLVNALARPDGNTTGVSGFVA